MANHVTIITRRAMLDAVVAIPAVAMIGAMPALAAPSASGWDAAMITYERAKKRAARFDVYHDRVMVGWEANKPSQAIIDWSEFPFSDRNAVAHTLDIDAYRRWVISNENGLWTGSALAKQRRLDAIDTVAEYRRLRTVNDRRFNIERVCTSFERHDDAVVAAEHALMAMPAPNLRALQWKLRHGITADEDGHLQSFSMDYLKPIFDDVDRLIEERADA
ncbi:hypothetical protein [Sphingomonas oligophenolica]|uniref:Uncharacterized protein n=1 Tax=Sphingomonas oligophenolica TaxID=301154 RepID=A0A502CK29_9SPHN|nr:hypothetical protein [Sphingomonas oligophenolica]TPG13163.1 hypothetical protein EAH84_07120 [Sphingomonas oligophenolica]